MIQKSGFENKKTGLNHKTGGAIDDSMRPPQIRYPLRSGQQQEEQPVDKTEILAPEIDAVEPDNQWIPVVDQTVPDGNIILFKSQVSSAAPVNEGMNGSNGMTLLQTRYILITIKAVN